MVANSKDRHTNGGTNVVNYTICRPGGNDTALVYGSDYTAGEKKSINDVIMAKLLS